MTKKTIYFIHSPSPTLGRSPLQKGFFPYAFTRKYIQSLQSEVDRLGLEWKVIADDTESDIEILIARSPALLVCAPGLRYQFFHRGFDKHKIIWLNVMEYLSADPKSVIEKLAECAAGGS
ncbi:hypothetical protein HA50_22785 [Pantoea cypripedii]|uniref:Nitrogen fixation protein NifS n=1 Tax=Pantoea cypripedii TaxID=55209 RepID=A0A1X1EKN4_PANCY|nr:hypothetical protein HA50_22785 [Pantoea cypripedii]